MAKITHLGGSKETFLGAPLDPDLSWTLYDFPQIFVVGFLRWCPNEHVVNDGFAPVNAFKCHVYGLLEHLLCRMYAEWLSGEAIMPKKRAESG